MTRPLERRQNHLLAALPDPIRQRWLPLLEPIDPPLAAILDQTEHALIVRAGPQAQAARTCPPAS
ncbi:MAG: hypothetical protein RL456_3345 [Pseudomonadota bacterium]|jgi:hypothetical protein